MSYRFSDDIAHYKVKYETLILAAAICEKCLNFSTRIFICNIKETPAISVSYTWWYIGLSQDKRKKIFWTLLPHYRDVNVLDLGSDTPYVIQSTSQSTALAHIYKCFKMWRIKS